MYGACRARTVSSIHAAYTAQRHLTSKYGWFSWGIAGGYTILCGEDVTTARASVASTNLPSIPILHPLVAALNLWTAKKNVDMLREVEECMRC
eukprot:53282-Eustigmatos_ZCMA.PRE.1